MSKAEDLSQNRYPTLAEKYAYIDGYHQAEEDLTYKAHFSSGWDGFYYGQGYKQAEKDLELTWKDIKIILDAENDILRECNSRKELVIEIYPKEEDYYGEVLKRFKDFRERKEK